MHSRVHSGKWIRQGNTITLLGLIGSGGGAVGLEPELELETGRPTLRRGSTGTAVRDLQTRLLSIGISPGPVDGIFGSGTEGAVKSLQRARGLTVDGIVGPQTWGALDSAAPAGPGPQVPTGPYTPGTGAGSSLQSILAAMTRKRYTIFTQPYRLNIVGVRNMIGEPNRFDDSIHVFFKDNAGKWVHKENAATTDPGTFFLLNPLRVEGTAIVVPGQYPGSHQIGLHNKEYTALVQKGPITVVRDPNKDDRLDFTTGIPTTGLYGINIHRATPSGTSTIVNKFSAGCQVFASSSDFAQFIEWAKRHSQMYGNSFTYTLLEETDL